MLKNISKKELSWIFYDWANSAYTMVVTSTIMSLYFLDSAGTALAGKVADPAVTANAYWGFGNSFSTILLVILSPILGTLADYKGKKKRYFYFFLWTFRMVFFFPGRAAGSCFLEPWYAARSKRFPDFSRPEEPDLEFCPA